MTMVYIVSETSSHKQGEPFLNNTIDKGAEIGPEMLQLLLQSPCSLIALTADIREAFLPL